MKVLRYQTGTSIIIGPFISSGDGATRITSLSAADISISIVKGSDSGPLSAETLSITDSGGDNDISHIISGYYSLELTSGNADTYGRFDVLSQSSLTLAGWDSYMVTTYNFWDSMYNTSALSADSEAYVSSALSAYETTGVASKLDVLNIPISADVEASAVAAAISGSIISGIGEWGDLRWSKIYGIPLDEWDVIVGPYTE